MDALPQELEEIVVRRALSENKSGTLVAVRSVCRLWRGWSPNPMDAHRSDVERDLNHEDVVVTCYDRADARGRVMREVVMQLLSSSGRYTDRSKVFIYCEKKRAPSWARLEDARIELRHGGVDAFCVDTILYSLIPNSILMVIDDDRISASDSKNVVVRMRLRYRPSMSMVAFVHPRENGTVAMLLVKMATAVVYHDVHTVRLWDIPCLPPATATPRTSKANRLLQSMMGSDRCLIYSRPKSYAGVAPQDLVAVLTPFRSVKEYPIVAPPEAISWFDIQPGPARPILSDVHCAIALLAAILCLLAVFVS